MGSPPGFRTGADSDSDDFGVQGKTGQKRLIRTCKEPLRLEANSAWNSPLKVRLIGHWHVGILIAVVFVRVLSADGFLKRAWIWHVGQRRGKGRRENPLVLDGYLHLQELAAALAPNIANEHPIFFLVPLDGVFDICVIAQR
jgi:hypothetical protein